MSLVCSFLLKQIDSVSYTRTIEADVRPSKVENTLQTCINRNLKWTGTKWIWMQCWMCDKKSKAEKISGIRTYCEDTKQVKLSNITIGKKNLLQANASQSTIPMHWTVIAKRQKSRENSAFTHQSKWLWKMCFMDSKTQTSISSSEVPNKMDNNDKVKKPKEKRRWAMNKLGAKSDPLMDDFG